MNSIVQSLWVGNQLSPMEQMCILSYIKNGHSFHLYTYEPIYNIPKGTVVKDAREIIPAKSLIIDEFGGYVNISNKFRYTLLFLKGGWWVDMDTVCLKPFDFEENFIFSSERSEPHQRFLVNTTFIKSLPGNPFLKDCIDFIEFRGYDHIHWGELGVNLISRMIFRNNLETYIKPPDIFCPISIYKFELFFIDTGYELPQHSFALHWWNEIWKGRRINKNNNFHHRCLFEKMKNLYLR